jgi:hypothetical protein
MVTLERATSDSSQGSVYESVMIGLFDESQTF